MPNRWKNPSYDGGKRPRKLVCKRGHRLAPDNVYVSVDGGRQCKQCSLARAAKRRRRNYFARQAKAGICRREHDLNADGTCTDCALLLYEAKMKRAIRLDRWGMLPKRTS